MAAMASELTTPVQHIQHERFTAKQHGYQLEYLSLDLSGNIAVSGYHSSGRTYIDLYSRNNSDSRDKLKLCYSKEFEKYSYYRYRYVSFFDKNVSKLVTCIGDKIEIIDTKNESKVLRSCRVNGVTRCLAVREGEIFIGLVESQTVLVFNNDLKETRKIRIKGIKDGDWPLDLQVIKDIVFLCTATRLGWYDRVLSLSVYDGSIVSEYTDTTGKYRNEEAYSMAVSEVMNLVAVSWVGRRIIVYSLNKNKKSFLVFDVDNYVTRIRISDRDRMIITGNTATGEIQMYSLEQLFSFEAMKRTLAYIVSPEEFEDLRKYFGVTGEEMRRLETGDEDKKLSDKEHTVREMECLLTVIEEKGLLSTYNVDKLTDAVSTIGDEIRISDLKGPMEGYSIHSKNMKLIRAEMMTRQKAWEDERNQLSSKLETAESEVKRSVEDRSLVGSEVTRDERGAILAAEFGRLTVAIAEQLRLDDCLRLAKFCNIPASDCDSVLRVSLIESPGMKLLDVLKKRKLINIFDVTNLQKALAVLQLEAVNYDLVAPYQEKIDKEQYELYKVEEIYTWEEIDAFVNATKDLSAQRQIRDSQTSPIDDTETEYASQTEAQDEDRGSFLGGRHHQLYIEHSIGREGGTIQLANVSLTVPPDALHESHVIALSVMNESPFPLDREVDTARMTPLIKLEPLGLMFKKSLQLNIPHSALISEPEHHDVIIYSGQIEDSSDSIRWTEERSIPRQLKEKSVTVDIQCLTYLSASLVSQTSALPLFIVRAVPFVDGVRNTDDDIILTICFCSDSDAEYNMLLSDYNTKLPLEQYSTIQLCRHPERDEDDAGFLSVTVTSYNNTYVPDADQAVKQFSISHLCTASRVSHQLRLQKNKDIDRDDVQVLLTFSQSERTSTKIFMKTRIKDLMISQESEDFLIGSVFTVLKPYNELKANISSMLGKYHCKKLATCFDLTPAELERVENDASPGRMLMEILDEREKIMPQKMFDLYQGLKVCHLDKIARLVFEYIEKNSNETQQEKHKKEKDKCAKGIPENASVSQRTLQKRQDRRSQIDKSVQTTVTVTSSSSDSVLKMLNEELCLDEDKTSDTLSVTHHPYTTLKWIKEYFGVMRYMLPIFVDGILQTQRGVFTLPRVFKN
ncbi:hypothetical protein HOLleu_36260 [Holothuria leucospilota]|uniref:ZU5 domain-containing protein n=1 Tax=Holothuria leucospilota TaxID=206669 RepID=A0A9Q1BFX6_HOLLE|nr:hypothetical protein HOLleu_36260 [Holothuria leucospilota]